jgi:putative PIN family toxin of toxin-antitoxin system
MEKLRTVFDCNTFVQALFNPKGFAMRCFEAVKTGEITLFVSPETLLEIREVLQRPNLIAHFPNTNLEQIDVFLDEILCFAIEIKKVPHKFQYLRDIDDIPYINLAVEAKADYLVSRDRDLLDLMTDFTDEAKGFRQRFRPLKVIEPKELLQIIKTREQK